MIVIGLILAVAAVGFFSWLLFELAVYALPCFLALSAGFWAYQRGASLPAAAVATVTVAMATFLSGKLAFTLVRMALTRFAIALLFAVPAGIAGFYAALGIARAAGLDPHWCDRLAPIGALLVGITSFARIAIVPPPGSANLPHSPPRVTLVDGC